MSAPAIPLWEECDVDADSSCSAIHLASFSHACWHLLTLLLSLHPSAAPGNTLICCISYLLLVREISFLSLLPRKSLWPRCRSAFLSLTAGELFTAGGSTVRSWDPHHLSPHAPTPLHRTLRLCFSRPLKPCQPCISLYCRCVKSQKYLTLPKITAGSCYVWKTSIVPHRGKQNEHRHLAKWRNYRHS